MNIFKYLIPYILASTFVTPALAWTKDEINLQIDWTNVLVNNGCSGTFINDTEVLTAFHCVRDQFQDVERSRVQDDGTVKKEKVRLAVPGIVSQISYGQNSTMDMKLSVSYKIKKSDSRVDLALLSVSRKNILGGVKLSCTEPERGDTVYAVGNPFGVLYASLSKGIIGSTQRSYRDLELSGQLGDSTDLGEHGLVQHTALIAPGSSGGALYNDKGEFIGVNVRGGAGFAFAVPLSDIREFLGNETCK
jgi:S1-C subfamily serine protease